MKIVEKFSGNNGSKTFEAFSIKEELYENHLEIFFLIYVFETWRWVLAKHYKPLEQ